MDGAKRPRTSPARTSLVDSEWDTVVEDILDSPRARPDSPQTVARPELSTVDLDDGEVQTVQIDRDRLRELTTYEAGQSDKDTEVMSVSRKDQLRMTELEGESDVDSLLASEEERRLPPPPGAAPRFSPRPAAGGYAPRTPPPPPPAPRLSRSEPAPPAKPPAPLPSFGTPDAPPLQSPPPAPVPTVELGAPLGAEYSPPSRPPAPQKAQLHLEERSVEADLRAMQRGSQSGRLWMVLGIVLPLAVGIGIGIGIWVFGKQTASPAAAAPPRPSTAVVEEPAPSATAPPTLLERARAGEHKVLDELKERLPRERTSEETIALYTGRSKNKSLALEGFAAEIAKKPDLLDDKEQLARLKDFFYDRETTNQAAGVIVGLPGEFAADLLYELWTGTKRRDESTMLAEELVYSKDVREKASEPLKVALLLRDVEECPEAKELVQRANELGDRRSVHLLAKFNNKWGCGPKKRDDCWECLRKLDDEKDAVTIVDAIRSANKRAAPRL